MALSGSLLGWFSKGIYCQFESRNLQRKTWMFLQSVNQLGFYNIPSTYRSIKIMNLCVCVCVCVCVFLKYLCGSGSDWSESFNMAAAWFKGVQCCICLDCNDTLINYFINALQIPRALSTGATTVMCAPEPPTRATSWVGGHTSRSKTKLRVNNVRHAFLRTLPSLH